jgi:hypothetical protein
MPVNVTANPPGVAKLTLFPFVPAVETIVTMKRVLGVNGTAVAPALLSRRQVPQDSSGHGSGAGQPEKLAHGCRHRLAAAASGALSDVEHEIEAPVFQRPREVWIGRHRRRLDAQIVSLN